MADTQSTIELIKQLCQILTPNHLGSRDLEKLCIKQLGYLLKLSPQNGKAERILPENVGPLENIVAESFCMRWNRLFDDAEKLQDIVDQWLDKKVCSEVNQDSFNKCVTFLLGLKNWKSRLEDDGKWEIQIPEVSSHTSYRNLLKVPQNYKDTNVYSSTFCYMHYPKEIFERKMQSIWREGDISSDIFEKVPTVLNNCDMLENNGANRSSLFGALRKPIPFSLNMSLDLPILTEKVAESPMHFTLHEDNIEKLSQENKTTPEDEGFRDFDPNDYVASEDETLIWDKVSCMNNMPKKDWETRIGPPTEIIRKRFLTQAGPVAASNAYSCYLQNLQLIAGLSMSSLNIDGPLHLTMPQLIKDVVHLLLGVASETFLFNQETQSFFVKSSSYISGTSLCSVDHLMQDFLDCGSTYIYLESFSGGNALGCSYDSGFVVKRFKEGVFNYLQHYRGFILHASETNGSTLLKLHQFVYGIYRQLKYLKELCEGRHGSRRIGLKKNLPKGLRLLSFLYEQAQLEWGGDNTFLLLYLLRSALSPYFNYLQGWLFEGICNDPHNEFNIEINESCLSQKFNGESFWTNGYRLREKGFEIPFLGDDLNKAILLSGKSLNLLKLCYHRHKLFNIMFELRPVLALSLSEEEINQTKDSCQIYYNSVLNLLNDAKSIKTKKKRSLVELVNLDNEDKEEIDDRGLNSSIEFERKDFENDVKLPCSLIRGQSSELLPVILPSKNDIIDTEDDLRNEIELEYAEREKALDAKNLVLDWQTSRFDLHAKRLEFYKAENLENPKIHEIISDEPTLTKPKERLDPCLSLMETTNIAFPVYNDRPLSSASRTKSESKSEPEDYLTRGSASDTTSVSSDDKVTLRSGLRSAGRGIRRRSKISSISEDESVPFNFQDEPDTPLDEEESFFQTSEFDYKPVKKSVSHLDFSKMFAGQRQERMPKSKSMGFMNEDTERKVEGYAQPTVQPYQMDYGAWPLVDIFNLPELTSPTVEENEDLSYCKFIPLSVLLQQSLHPPIISQLKLVNEATLDYFVEDLHIYDHFAALRNYFFFNDGEFGHSLSLQIFEKISNGSRNMIMALGNKFELAQILDVALLSSIYSSSETSFSELLSFRVKDGIENLELAGSDILECLELNYKTEWPVNLVITESSLKDYNCIFSLLLEVKYVLWVLNDIWFHLKRADHQGELSGMPEFRKIELYRHEMLHFARSVHAHICCQILQLSWEEFQKKLKKQVGDLDNLREFHTEYLSVAMKRCLLGTNDADKDLLKMVKGIFNHIVIFHKQILSLPWRFGRGKDEESYKQVVATYSDFSSCTTQLYKVLRVSSEGGGQQEQHVLDFLSASDFNRYFEYKTSSHSVVSELAFSSLKLRTFINL